MNVLGYVKEENHIFCSLLSHSLYLNYKPVHLQSGGDNMRLKLPLAILLASLTLGACATEEETPTEPTDQETTIDTLEDQAADDDDPADAVVTDEQLAPVSEDELEAAESIDNLDDYEEFNEQDTFNPEGLDAHLVSDDETERVIVFTENGEQAFKSIFVKEDNRLLLINLLDQEVLQNDPI